MAPAGSGKTTLLSDWLHSCPCPSAWLSLDEGDSDLGTFLTYFVAAIRTIFPDACEQTLALLQAIETPPTRILVSTLINEIEVLHGHPVLATDKSFVLVLDDYHLIAGQEVNSLLIEILRHPPQTMRLVLATRSDPALPLANLRARGKVTEIRWHDLRFSREETAEYLERATNQPISRDSATSLADKTEGWITGLHLAVLNLRHVADSGEFVSGFEANDRNVMDYLMDEVLSRQTTEIQEFLLKTSMLDRLCGPLCEVVTRLGDGVYDGLAYLEWLEQANLFIVPLDSQRQWYRYHHLFQLLLQNRLQRQYSEEEIADLHRRASAWYAENGFVEDSVVHALTAGDEAAAVRVIVSHRHDAMNHERWQQIERWLRLLPRRLVDEQPELLLLEAWILQRLWRFPDIPQLLERIDARIEANATVSDVRFLRGETDALRSMLSFYTLNSGETTSALAKRALDALPMEASSVRALAWLYYGGGFLAKGETSRSRELFYEGLKEDTLHGDSFSGRVLVGLCVLNWLSADFRELRQIATHLLDVSNEHDLTESVGWALAFRGFGAYQANDLLAAESDFAAVTSQPYISHMAPYSQSVFGLASIYAARGDFAQADEIVNSLAVYGLQKNNLRIVRDADAFRAWLALKQGRTAEARRWVASFDRNAPMSPLVVFHSTEIVLAKVLVIQKTPQSLREAADLLGRLRSHIDKSNNTRWGAEVLALQALLEDAKGKTTEALSVLQHALELAEPGGVLRVFVDLGPRMAYLLTLLCRQNGAPDFIGRYCRPSPPSTLRAWI